MLLPRKATPLFLLLSVSLATPVGPVNAAIDRAVLTGNHDSACSPIRVEGKRTYSRFFLNFAGKRYASVETLYSDAKCEISVLQLSSQGSWELAYANVLRLSPSRAQLRPLDPRMADGFARNRRCGRRWEYGVATEILGTECGRGRHAEYFVDPSPSGKSLVLHECEGLGKIGPGCTRYGMAQSIRRAAPKPANPHDFGARINHPQL